MTAHPTPTPTEPHHDVREEWAARLQCADVAVDFPWLTEDGCDVWHEQSEATQEHYRRLLDLALSAGLQIPPTAAVSAAVPMTTTPPPEGTTEPRCEHTEHATRGDGRYGRHFETADPAGAWEPCPSPPVSAAAPDEREALYVDIANRAQEITGRGIWPSTVKAVLEVAASVSAAAPESPENPCASCGKPRREHRSGYSAYRCTFRAAAAPDEREALARAFAEHHARKVVYAIDYEHADVALTALAACPAPAVDGPSHGACWDCGRRYGDEYGFPDLVIPHDVWARISPTGDEGGLLCPSCICRRLHLAGITTTGHFTSGPLRSVARDGAR